MALCAMVTSGWSVVRSVSTPQRGGCGAPSSHRGPDAPDTRITLTTVSICSLKIGMDAGPQRDGGPVTGTPVTRPGFLRAFIADRLLPSSESCLHSSALEVGELVSHSWSPVLPHPLGHCSFKIGPTSSAFRSYKFVCKLFPQLSRTAPEERSSEVRCSAVSAASLRRWV